MEQSNEIWKPVTIAPYSAYYEVSSHGRVRSLDREIIDRNGRTVRRRGRVLSTSADACGYPRVGLNRGAKGNTRKVHSLVALAFLPDPPGEVSASGDGWSVNHIDGVKTNNRVENLEYVTKSGNIRHAWENKLLSHSGMKNSQATLTDQDIRDIRAAYAGGEPQSSLRARYGKSSSTISYIVRRITWTDVM